MDAWFVEWGNCDRIRCDSNAAGWCKHYVHDHIDDVVRDDGTDQWYLLGKRGS